MFYYLTIRDQTPVPSINPKGCHQVNTRGQHYLKSIRVGMSVDNMICLYIKIIVIINQICIGNGWKSNLDAHLISCYLSWGIFGYVESVFLVLKLLTFFSTFRHTFRVLSRIECPGILLLLGVRDWPIQWDRRGRDALPQVHRHWTYGTREALAQ